MDRLHDFLMWVYKFKKNLENYLQEQCCKTYLLAYTVDRPLKKKITTQVDHLKSCGDAESIPTGINLPRKRELVIFMYSSFPFLLISLLLPFSGN